jgi:hypothetical protein
VHVRNGRFCVGCVCIEDVCGTAVGINCKVREVLYTAGGNLTWSVHWHVQIPDGAISSKDLPQMIFIHILREFLNDDLERIRPSGAY